MNKYIYILDQRVLNQIWSWGNTITAFVEGLIDFDTNMQAYPFLPGECKNFGIMEK